MHLHDTIVAISSPPGPAARGFVRLSGPDAHRLAAAVFPALAHAGEHGPMPTVIEGQVHLAAGALPASAWLFAAPKSYTRQDMVELHLLGAPGVLGLVVESLIAAGARRAEAGEFTARAFLNGALDLAQVHGVAALISAQSEGQRRAAAQLLGGSLSKTAHAAREELADLLSLVEGALDFADEPIEFITPTDLCRRLNSVAASLQDTLDSSLQTERWSRAPRVLLAGRPNAGKSSLLNRLSGMDRAIATPTAGTTRDALTAPLRLDDVSCVLVDTAGVTEPSAEPVGGLSTGQNVKIKLAANDAADFMSRLADQATRTAVLEADLVIWMIDATAPASAWAVQFELLRNLWPRFPTGVIVALNKTDIAGADELRDWSRRMGDAGLDEPALISAATGAGCDDLQRRLARSLKTCVELDHESPIALAGEHHDALIRSVQALERAMKLAGASAPPRHAAPFGNRYHNETAVGDECHNASPSLADADLVALELHAAADALGVLVGKDVPDDLLGRVFARFCVGK